MTYLDQKDEKSAIQDEAYALMYKMWSTISGETRSVGERAGEHLRDIRYTKNLALASPPLPTHMVHQRPPPVSRHWGQSSHSADDLKINVLALIQRDPKDNYTTLYREHI